MTSRVRDQVKTNTQRFLDELWKHSDKGEEIVYINIGEPDKIDKDYKFIVQVYLSYLEDIGCIAYNYDYFGDHYQVAVKSKEAVQ
ncbi:hypothetical protein EFM17_00875 [Lactobacillus delbrueckii]|nr:hypothetical protein [Lactobacillus delbrueckii]